MTAPLLADGHPQAVGNARRPARRAFDHERELVAADAEDLVLRADDAQEDAPDLAQDLVAGDMPVARRSSA